MVDINVDALSLKELKELQNRVAKAIAGYEDRKRREALTEVEETARRLGFSLNELTVANVRKRPGQSAPKYANPDDPSQTWTGRGRKPKWMVEALRAGKSPDDLLI